MSVCSTLSEAGCFIREMVITVMDRSVVSSGELVVAFAVRAGGRGGGGAISIVPVIAFLHFGSPGEFVQFTVYFQILQF